NPGLVKGRPLIVADQRIARAQLQDAEPARVMIGAFDAPGKGGLTAWQVVTVHILVGCRGMEAELVSSRIRYELDECLGCTYLAQETSISDHVHVMTYEIMESLRAGEIRGREIFFELQEAGRFPGRSPAEA